MADAPLLPDPPRPTGDVNLSIQVEPHRPRAAFNAGGLVLRDPPRLGTGHVLVWITLISIYMGMAQPQGMPWDHMVRLLVRSSVAAVATGGCLLYLWHWLFRRSCWVMQPGEWLWVAVGIRTVLEFVGTPLHSLVDSPEPIAAAGMCAFLLIPLFRRQHGAWNFVFVVLILMFALPLLVACIGSDAGWFVPVIVGAIWAKVLVSALLPVLTALYERCRWHRRLRKRGSWMHWVGIAIWAASLLLGGGIAFPLGSNR